MFNNYNYLVKQKNKKMTTIKKKIEVLENDAALWMEKYGLRLLRISIGIVFFWFGVLKFFPGLSPAQELAINTIRIITFGMIPSMVIIVGLATWEVLIGLGFITGKFMRASIVLLLAQMPGTFVPIFVFPEQVFTAIPYGLTIEGQYIFKNFVLISAAFVIGSQVFKKKEKGQSKINS
jgi:uncharacterized membrane protein YkgB